MYVIPDNVCLTPDGSEKWHVLLQPKGTSRACWRRRRRRRSRRSGRPWVAQAADSKPHPLTGNLLAEAKASVGFSDDRAMASTPVANVASLTDGTPTPPRTLFMPWIVISAAENARSASSC